MPVEACIEADGYDMSTFLPRAAKAYSTEGVQWAMPFNVSDPVLFYNKKIFEKAGLDPTKPPLTLEEVRADSQKIVDSKAAAYGIALDTGADSGGGWYLEQWFAKAGELYADNENGRAAPATRVLYDGPKGVELITYLQGLVNDGLAVNVGDNASGQDNFFKMADPAEPAAMTIGTSAALGSLLSVVRGGHHPRHHRSRHRRRADARPRRCARRARRRRLAVDRRRQGRRQDGRRVGLHQVPRRGPDPEHLGRRLGLRAGALRRPRRSTRSSRSTSPTRGSRSPTRSCRRPPTSRRRSGRCSARCATCGRSTARAMAAALNGTPAQKALTAGATQSNKLIANYNARH